MTPLREEALKRIELAERDRRAFHVLAAAPEIDRAVAGFHAQQAVEKALKAVLVGHGIEFRRTHDLQLLADRLVGDLGMQLSVPETELRRLTPFAVEARHQLADDLMIGRDEVVSLMNAALDWARNAVSVDSPRA